MRNQEKLLTVFDKRLGIPRRLEEIDAYTLVETGRYHFVPKRVWKRFKKAMKKNA